MSKARTLSNFISSGSPLADGTISVSEVSGAAPSDNPSFTGNITVGGTVDGRDLAADGTKLDGIEAGATADQTKADIDALGIDAATLGGNNAAYFTGYTDTAVANLVDAAPGTLDTLNELAAALGDDPNFATTVTNSIATKLPLSGGTMTGNITFNSTQLFDGRDVSADGAKLDGIEAGATADQTAAEILTAIKTVDGTGSGLDADLLDGQHGSYYQPASTAITTSNIGSQAVSSAGILRIVDTRNAGARLPNDYEDFAVTAEFTDDLRGAWWSGLTVKGWHDGYAPWSLIGHASTGQDINLYFRAGHGSNNTWSSQYKLWHEGNDGSGSGLDADLLDGMQTGQGSNNIPYTGSTGNLVLFDPENYIGEVRLGAAWDRGGIYASNTLTMATSSNTMHMVFGNAVKHTFDSNGNFTAVGNITAYSDERLKENIVTIDNALDKVNAIRGVTYNRNDIEDTSRHAGVIAQEVEKVLPEVVKTDKEGIKTVAYGNMVGLLIEAIKEQQKQIDELKAKLEG